MLFSLSGCFWFFAEGAALEGLAGMAARGLAAESFAARIAAGAELSAAVGGARVFAVRAVSSNVGAAMLASPEFLAGGSRTVAITVRGGGEQSVGSMFVESGSRAIRVQIGDGQALRVVRGPSKFGEVGDIANHFDLKGNRVSYTRYSPDGLRFDYYVPKGNGQFRSVMYGLRSPATGDVTLFGENHRYLGRAIYRARSIRGGGGGALALGAASAFVVTLDNAQSGDGYNLCSLRYILLRQTHFQQNWDTSTPLQFWNSMYDDCPNDSVVSQSLQKALLNDAVDERGRSIKLGKLDRLIERFPDNREAKAIRERVRQW